MDEQSGDTQSVSPTSVRIAVPFNQIALKDAMELPSSPKPSIENDRNNSVKTIYHRSSVLFKVATEGLAFFRPRLGRKVTISLALVADAERNICGGTCEPLPRTAIKGCRY